MPYNPEFDLCAHRITNVLAGKPVGPEAEAEAVANAFLHGVPGVADCFEELSAAEDDTQRFLVKCGVRGCQTRRTLTEFNGTYLPQADSAETALDICHS